MKIRWHFYSKAQIANTKSSINQIVNPSFSEIFHDRQGMLLGKVFNSFNWGTYPPIYLRFSFSCQPWLMGACPFDFQCFSFLTSLSEISFVLSYNVPHSKGDTFNCCENKINLLERFALYCWLASNFEKIYYLLFWKHYIRYF